MMYILDTNVVSETRKASRKQSGPAKATATIDGRVQRWLASVDSSSLFLSAVTILELEIGCLLLERRDPAQGAILRKWIRNHVLVAFSGRVLPIDVAVAQRCAALHVPDPLEDRDSLIAATALVHGMTVVTRNTSHFERTGVALLNPWQY
jgi:predicted nucleic acid-binding protein